MTLRWEQKTAKYSWGWDGYLGQYRVAEAHVPTHSKSYVGPRWSARVLLPGIDVRQGLLVDTEQDAMALADHVVTLWLQRAGVS